MNVTKELAVLERLSVGELQTRYAELFHETPRSRHRRYLIRRIAWRLQAQAEGGLSERALRRAEELADPAEARTTPPGAVHPKASRRAASIPPPSQSSGARLPPIGTVLTRSYKGRRLAVTVAAEGFVYEGERFNSLSAVAKAITGSHMSGLRFFGLEDTR